MATTWGGKAAMFANVRVKIAGHAAALGLSPAEITAIFNLCDEYAAVYAYHTQMLAGAAALTEWRDLAMSGQPKGDPLPDPPASPAWVAPSNGILGILTTFRDKRDEWVAAPGYTQTIGEDLMIVKPDGGELPEEDVTPTIQVSAADTGYLFAIMVAGRAAADQWKVETRQKGQDWKNAGSFTGKSADITITPLTPGDPEKVEVRVRLRLKNEDYGNLSQIATVTVNP